MKKIYVYNLLDSWVDNIDKIKIENINSISNGSCDLLLCDCLDSVLLTDRITLTSELVKKLTINGKLTLKFISLVNLSKLILTNQISIQEINNVFASCLSVIDEDLFAQQIEQFNNLDCIENFYNGLFRQVTLERKS